MPVQDAEIVAKNEPVTDAPKETVNNTEAPKPSPAQDLRDIQMLIVAGMFPGNVSPQVVKAYQLLEKMAQQIEADAKTK